jgi:mannose-1-phosphate guanylyltransferase
VARTILSRSPSGRRSSLLKSKKSSARTENNVWVAVLAGGIGSRFWPVSTPERPKQLLPLASARPLIVDTVDRARSLVPDEKIRILAGAHLAATFQGVVDRLPDSSYWIEPRARGTAPVLAWAAWKLARLDPDAVMVSLHADHLIRPIESFRETVAVAVEVARRDELLISICVKPDRIETGYGHVELGEALPEAGPARAYRVHTFHEKPDSETARRYVDKGYLWNTGIFVWKASVLLAEIETHAPDLFRHLPLIDESDVAFFDAVPVSVIDREIMERSDRVGTVAATFEWDDVGSWEALSRTKASDESGNVFVGPGHAVNSSGNVTYSEKGSVVLFGVSDLIVVQTDDTTLVIPRDRAADIKTFLAKLEEES